MGEAEEFDPKQATRTAIALLTAGVETEEALDIFVDITDNLSCQEVVEVLAAMVGLSRQIVTDEQLQNAGRYVA